ncbi:hypothetical protein GCM10009740_00940 [Terrabacter terrae]|uniref:Transposase n=1 Tax=Terrabacter terrae TaxID=318434 RepID=A0ABN2TQ97_9MICO
MREGGAVRGIGAALQSGTPDRGGSGADRGTIASESANIQSNAAARRIGVPPSVTERRRATRPCRRSVAPRSADQSRDPTRYLGEGRFGALPPMEADAGSARAQEVGACSGEKARPLADRVTHRALWALRADSTSVATARRVNEQQER